MKIKLFRIFFLIVLILQIYSPIFSQIGGVQCNPNSFWGVKATVDEFAIIGNTISYTSTICQGYNLNLAYCNNLDSGGFSPTFYDSSPHQTAYYNGTDWIVDSAISEGRINNPGGFGNYLYFTDAPVGGVQSDIVRYNGVSFTTIYSIPDSNYIILIKDIAVDEIGNVWFFSGPNQEPFYTTKLNVVSPDGHLIKQFPFSINSISCYGLFLLNGILYIGAGGIQSLVPVTISNDSAIAGTPLPMPSSGYIDLASCSPGLPLSANSNPTKNIGGIYPNPVHTFLNFAIDKDLNITMFNVLGEIIFERFILFEGNGNSQIDLSSFSSGIYFIKLDNETIRIVKI